VHKLFRFKLGDGSMRSLERTRAAKERVLVSMWIEGKEDAGRFYCTLPESLDAREKHTQRRIRAGRHFSLLISNKEKWIKTELRRPDEIRINTIGFPLFGFLLSTA